YAPRVIIIEDLHWVDSGTWNLAFDISRTVPNLLVVFTTRPLRPTPVTYTKMTRLKNCTLMTLDLLNKEAMTRLAAYKLGVQSVPADLLTMIQNKSGGHPLYIEEVIQTMLEQKMVRVDNSGNVEILQKSMDVLPDNMQGVMVGRIDRLTTEEQITLKVCAV